MEFQIHLEYNSRWWNCLIPSDFLCRWSYLQRRSLMFSFFSLDDVYLSRSFYFLYSILFLYQYTNWNLNRNSESKNSVGPELWGEIIWFVVSFFRWIHFLSITSLMSFLKLETDFIFSQILFSQNLFSQILISGWILFSKLLFVKSNFCYFNIMILWILSLIYFL